MTATRITAPTTPAGLYRRGYHRISDDSTSFYNGHATREGALDEALGLLDDDDIDEVWVTGPNGPVFHSHSDAQI